MQIDHGVVRRRYPGGLPARHASRGYLGPPYRPSQTPFPVRRRGLGGTRVAAAAAVAIVAVIVFAPPASPVTGPDTRAIEWGGRSFSVSADLAAWLSARGVTYETWARRHSAAAARLEGEEPVGEDPVGASGTADELEESVAGVAGDDLSSPSTWSSTVAVVLFALALSLLLVAVLPRSIFARAQAEAVWNRRLDLATVGLAVAVGLVIVLIF